MKRVTRAGEQHALAIGILGDGACVGHWSPGRQVAGDPGPGLAVVAGLVQERIAVVVQVHIDGQIGGGRVEVGGLNLRHHAHRGQAFDICRDIVPLGSAVARVPDFAVVGAHPDEPLLNFRWSDGEHYGAVELAQIVAYNSARRHDDFGVTRRQILTDHVPRIAAVGGSEHDLATVVDRVVIERVDGHRRAPMAAVFGDVGLRIQRVQPRADRSRELSFRVIAGHLVAVASGPDDVGVGHIRQREAGFATAEAVFPGDRRAASKSARGAALSRHVRTRLWSVAGPAHRR